jgi:hypothetical protein
MRDSETKRNILKVKLKFEEPWPSKLNNLSNFCDDYIPDNKYLDI